MNAGEAKQRIQGAVDEMKKIKKKAEESVADVDPTLFTGNVDEASCARIEKLLVMSITYRPRAVETKKTKWNGRGRKGNQGEKQKPEAKAKETKAEKQKSEARTKAVNAKKQILTKEKKKYNVKGKSQLSKREWESGNPRAPIPIHPRLESQIGRRSKERIRRTLVFRFIVKAFLPQTPNIHLYLLIIFREFLRSERRVPGVV